MGKKKKKININKCLVGEESHVKAGTIWGGHQRARGSGPKARAQGAGVTIETGRGLGPFFRPVTGVARDRVVSAQLNKLNWAHGQIIMATCLFRTARSLIWAHLGRYQRRLAIGGVQRFCKGRMWGG